MTQPQFLKAFSTIMNRVIETVVNAQRAEFDVIFDQLAAQRDLPWAKAVLAAGDLNETVKLLKTERQRQAISMYELQATTGITRSTLSEFESQKRGSPSIATVERIAAALGVKLLVALVEAEAPQEKVGAAAEGPLEVSSASK